MVVKLSLSRSKISTTSTWVLPCQGQGSSRKSKKTKFLAFKNYFFSQKRYRIKLQKLYILVNNIRDNKEQNFCKMPSCLFPISSSEWGGKRGCSHHEKQCLVQNKSQVHCEWCSTVLWLPWSLSDRWQEVFSEEQFLMEAPGLHPKFQIPDISCIWDRGTGLSETHYPADLLCQNKIVWSRQQKWMRERERELCMEKVAYCANTHSPLMTIKDLLSPDCPSL